MVAARLSHIWPARDLRVWIVGCAFFLSVFCPTVYATETPTEVRERAYQAYLEKGPHEALPIFEQALELHRGSGDRLGEAITIGLIGNCYKRLGDYSKALEHLNQALLIKRVLGDKLETGKTLSHIGLVFWEMGEYTQAIRNFTDSIKIAQEIKHRRLEGSALNNLSLVYDELGDYKKSLDGYHRVLELYESENFARGESDTLANIGGVYLLLGQFSKALEIYQQALILDEKSGLNPAISASLGNIGLCYLGLGETDEAIKAFDRALALAQSARLLQEEAYWLRGKGNAFISRGRYDLGLELHSQALVLSEESGSKGQLITALAENGDLLLQLGDLASAERQFQRSYALAQEIEQHRGVTQSLIALGDLQWYRQQYSQAASFYERALARAQEVDDRVRAAGSLTQLALSYNELGRPEEAMQRATEALSLAHQSDISVLIARSLFVLGELERAASRPDRAMQHYNDARQIADVIDDPEVLWRLNFGIAVALSSMGEKEQAVGALIRAINIIESVRGRLREERYRAGYLEDKSEVYIELVRLLLELGKIDEAFTAAEKLRSRNFQELLDRNYTHTSLNAEEQARKIELRERIITLRKSLADERDLPPVDRREPAIRTFSAELAAAERAYQVLVDNLRLADSDAHNKAKQVHIPDIQELQRNLGEDRSVIEYVVSEDRILVFVLTSKFIQATSISVRRRDIDAKVELLRELIMIPGSDAWQKPAASLAEYLIAPIVDNGWLDGIDTLHVIPHGILNYLPFSVLLGSVDGQVRFLIEDYEIAYLPSAVVLGSNGITREPTNSILALAPDSTLLKHAQNEVRSIAKHFSGARLVLTGSKATEDSFKRHASNYQTLHLATHGTFNKFNPLLSGLALEPGSGEDGQLQVHEILDLKLNANLVTLSACDTALASGYYADVPVGDEFVGLTRSFLLAGADSILASLWEVNDRSTLEFMESFYRRLTEESEMESLAQVQRYLIKSNGAYRHPYYWAPFVLIGAEAKYSN